MISSYFIERSTSYVSFVDSKPKSKEIMINEPIQPDEKQMFNELVDFVSADSVIANAVPTNAVPTNADALLVSNKTESIETTSLDSLPFTNNIDTS